MGWLRNVLLKENCSNCGVLKLIESIFQSFHGKARRGQEEEDGDDEDEDGEEPLLSGQRSHSSLENFWVKHSGTVDLFKHPHLGNCPHSFRCGHKTGRDRQSQKVEPQMAFRFPKEK